MLPRQIKLNYFSAYTPALEDYAQQSPIARGERLRQARFRRTWYIRSGRHRGKAALKPSFPSNPSLRVWEGPLFNEEYSDCILLRNVQVDAEGRLSEDTISLARELSIPHASIRAIEDEGKIPTKEDTTPPLFMFSQRPVCECPKCTSLLSRKRRRKSKCDGQQQTLLKKQKIGVDATSTQRTPIGSSS